MDFNRRELLAGGLALSAACTPTATPPDDPPSPAPERQPSPDRPVVETPLDAAVFPWGVVVGEVARGEALLRVRADVDALTLHVRVHDGDWVSFDGPVAERVGFTFRAVLEGLPDDASVAVWAEAAGVRSAVARFRTPPAERRRIRFAASSCFGDGDWAMPNLQHVDGHDVDFFALLGDTVYADGARTREDYEASWAQHLARPAMNTLFASTSMVAVWDDHEVDNNWSLDPEHPYAISEETLDAAIAVMDDCLPQRTTDVRYRTYAFGPDVELFLLDCRGERQEGRIVSDTQLQWLVDALGTSAARIKIVLSSIHAADHFDLVGEIQVDDRWQGAPDQRATLVAALSATDGVFVVTGDMHFGSVHHLDAEGPGAEVLEIAAGPSGSRVLPIEGIADLRGGLTDQYLAAFSSRSWCRFDVDPGTGDVEVRFIGDDGEILFEHGFTV